MSRIENVERAVTAKPSPPLRALDELSPDMGDQIAGRFIAPTDESSEPTDSAFSGSFLSGEPQIMPDGTQDSFVARLIAGIVQLSLGVEGFFFNSLTNGYKHIADDGTTFRRGDLGMTTLPGRTAPSFGLTYQDNASASELLTNGGFETGDFTGWTADSGSGWSVTTVGAYGGTYCATTTSLGVKSQTANITGGSTLILKGYGISTGVAKIRLLFYTGAAGSGTFISEYVINLSTSGVFYERSVTSPSNALSAKLEIFVNSGGTATFDSLSLKVNTLTNYLGFEPADGKLVSNMLDGADVAGQIPVGSMRVLRVEEAKDKLVVSLGGVGSVDTGVKGFITTFVDQYGETDADLSQATSFNVSAGSRSLDFTSVPLGKWGTTARKIYATISGATQTDPLQYYLAATINNNTGTTAGWGDDDATLVTGAQLPTVNTTASRPAWPRSAAVYADEVIVSYTQTNFVRAQSSARSYGFIYAVSAANANDGDQYYMSMMLEQGSYTFHMLGPTANNRGRIDWYVDGVLATSLQDWYSAGTVEDVEKTFTYTVTTSGYHHIELRVNGKNASSTDFIVSFGKIWATPTAY